MNTSRLRYRLADLVHESTENGDWIAPVPHGPIIQVQGSGTLILAVLEQAQADGELLDVAGILDRLHDLLDDVPADAEEHVQEFLRYLVEAGAALAS